MKPTQNKISTNFKMTGKEKEAIEEYCNREGMTQTEVLRRLVRTLDTYKP